MVVDSPKVMTKDIKTGRHRPAPWGLGTRRAVNNKRLILKNGECNITLANISRRHLRYLTDIFTTLVEIKWRYTLLLFTLAFVLSWLTFSFLWWLICLFNGDLENYENPDHKPCVDNVYDFTTALLFSIETQHTIGYGYRAAAPHCPETVLILMLQSCCGVIIQALMAGIVFAKLSRPKGRSATMMFSKNAVICRRDGQLVMLFRVADTRKSQLVAGSISGNMVRKKVTKEGEVLPLHQYSVSLGVEDCENNLFLVWPVCIVHKIDKSSPFYSFSAEQLLKEKFELVIILEGTVEPTGMVTQMRTSYLPDEILWGHRFERLITYQKLNGKYAIDYDRFHHTIPVDTPRCSARELEIVGNICQDHHSMSDSELDVDEVQTTITSTGTTLGTWLLRSRELDEEIAARESESGNNTYTDTQF